MKIGVIHTNSGWILSTIAKNMCCSSPDVFSEWPVFNINKAASNPLKEMDAWYYVDTQGCWNKSVKGLLPEAKHVGMFTHIHEDKIENFSEEWKELDGIVFMCQRYYDIALENKFFSPEQMIVIRPGQVSDVRLKKVKFGICQRGGVEGKGAAFLPVVLDALPIHIKDSIELHICGDGWVEEENILAGKGMCNGVMSLFYFEKDYRQIPTNVDYLFIPSMWEGGPMGVLDAMATGIPIISADVGWVREFVPSTSLFKPGDVEGAVKLIEQAVNPRLHNRSLVANITYANYARDVLSFIEGLEVER